MTSYQRVHNAVQKVLGKDAAKAQTILSELRRLGAWVPGDIVTDAMVAAAFRVYGLSAGWTEPSDTQEAHMGKMRLALNAALAARMQ